MQELHARTKLHFEPDGAFTKEANALACVLKCVACKRIPLDIRQCVMCEAVICKACRHAAEAAATSRDRVGCPACDLNPRLVLLRSKNKVA